MSGTELRTGWMSRPQSVLDNEHPDVYHVTPREPAELKSIKNKTSRHNMDLRNNRD